MDDGCDDAGSAIESGPPRLRDRCASLFWWTAGIENGHAGSSARERIVVMGYGFLFIFLAFNTTQMILSTVLKDYTGAVTHATYDLGDVSLMLIYVCACLSLPVVGRVIRYCGAGTTMVVGGLCYGVFIISLVSLWEPTVVLASCVAGFGQAALWVAQGVVLTESSDAATRGKDAGIFWGLYSAGSVIGPALGYFVYRSIDARGFFFFAAVCTLLGTHILRRVHRPRPPEVHQKRPFEGAKEHEALLGGDRDVALPRQRWTREKASILARLAPLIYFIGSSDSFVNAVFPVIFAPEADQEAAVFLVFVGWGVACTAGALLLSKLSDTLGRKQLLVAGSAAYVAALAACWQLLKAPGARVEPLLGGVSWLAFAAGALFGLNDTLNNVGCMALLGDHFPDAPLSVDAFAIYQRQSRVALLQSLGMASGFAFPLFVPVRWRTHLILFGLQLGLLVAAMAGVIAMPSCKGEPPRARSVCSPRESFRPGV
ncbi:major facilitator superfamily domain-containing protein [Pelagophyceae sp. CCMP2097]|nr:major facilitator superfamily domain-containing protein [Pelagophyceae sp. CCMP2097]